MTIMFILMIVIFLRGFSIWYMGELNNLVSRVFPYSAAVARERGPWERDFNMYVKIDRYQNFTIAPFIWHTERLDIFTCSIKRSHCRLFNTRRLIMRKIPLHTALHAGSMTTAKVLVPKCTDIMQ